MFRPTESAAIVIIIILYRGLGRDTKTPLTYPVSKEEAEEHNHHHHHHHGKLPYNGYSDEFLDRLEPNGNIPAGKGDIRYAVGSEHEHNNAPGELVLHRQFNQHWLLFVTRLKFKEKKKKFGS
ncbi:hypothetical protein HUJ04_008655 [Dendroctonus ponderosae]|nr:hypothetical protein HUJ04_008655 [Dendroctonus ponderosae]